jgi:hypothetical protein
MAASTSSAGRKEGKLSRVSRCQKFKSCPIADRDRSLRYLTKCVMEMTADVDSGKINFSTLLNKKNGYVGPDLNLAASYQEIR